ncbi:anti-sigma factor [Acidisphaera sp. L21]|uniref:anti-sigma factor family protein n=1 Tax=Acidisphaera sp. L21 TaxID=1641851 RepID=UPI00131DCBA4|nr:anti-sigma factor [Acidisphaera sp. L21]
MSDRIPDPRPVQEEELHAFVDDRLDPERREAVARRLAVDPALQRRVDDWRAQRDILRDALAFRHREPIPPALSLSSLAEARLAAGSRGNQWRLAASIVLALAVGGAGGWLAHGPQNPTEIARLSMEAASAYRTFANDSAHAIELRPDSAIELTGLITQKLGRSVAIPDLTALGYHLLGGRMLAVMYGPAAMLIYEDAQHNRITVYIQPMRRGDEMPMRSVDAGTVDGYAWINRQIGYSVMSEGDRARLHSIANRVRDSVGL